MFMPRVNAAVDITTVVSSIRIDIPFSLPLNPNKMPIINATNYLSTESIKPLHPIFICHPPLNGYHCSVCVNIVCLLPYIHRYGHVTQQPLTLQLVIFQILTFVCETDDTSCLFIYASLLSTANQFSPLFRPVVCN